MHCLRPAAAVSAGPPCGLGHRIFLAQGVTQLMETATRAGLYIAAAGGSLRLFSLEGMGGAVPITLGDTLFEARLELNAEHAITAVHAVSWDQFTGRRADTEATVARSGRRTRADVAPSMFAADGRHTLCDVPLSPGAGMTEAIAQATLDRVTGARLDLGGVGQGDPALRPGARVDVVGAGSAFDGTYVLTEVVHTVDAQRGYVSEFSSRPPRPVARPVGTVITPGLVTRVDDPKKLGRIQARLPTYPSLTTGWMRLVLPGAGPQKGLVCLPDVGDEVLVILPHGDPALGLILGGLHGAR